MAYAHGRKWTEQAVIDEIMGMVESLKLKSFPTHSQMQKHFGNSALTVKISKSGGTKYWANKVNLPILNCESELGNDFELFCMDKLISIGYDCEQMKPRYPYDIAVNGCIKVDVKSGFAFENYGKTKYFTFNLEKRNPTCDIYVIFCLNQDKSILKTYVIPSKFLLGKTQLALGFTESKNDIFIDKWDYFEKYNNFYSTIIV
jgi:hypothetical protein